MANPNFTATMSSNEIWFGTDSSVCLTDVVEGKAEANHSHTGYAAASHSHTGYAAEGHTHEGYAEADHSHTEYATADHAHTGYAEAGHTHSEYASAAALSGKADADHSHSEYAAASHSHTGYAAAEHSHDGYASASHTHSGYAASSHTHAQADVAGLSDALSGKANTQHTHAQSDVTGLATALEGKADATHTHSGYAASGHTHTPASIGAAASNHSHSDYAAAAHTHDYAAADHTHSGYAASGHTHTPASIGAAAASHSHTVDSALSSTSTNPVQNKVINSALAGKAAASHTHDYAASGHTHTPASIGAAAASHTHDYLPTSGGTVNGDVNVAGVIRGNGQQAYYYADSTKSQTIGTNNATGGTNIACGPDATCNIGGAIQKTASVLPRATNTYLLGNANFRWKGIYSAAAVNVSSDKRLKRDIDYFFEPDLLKFINALCVASYNYNDDPADSKKRIGLIAQEVIAANPALAEYFVDVDEGGYYNLRPADLVFPLIAAVQALTAEVNRLKERLDEK